MMIELCETGTPTIKRMGWPPQSNDGIPGKCFCDLIRERAWRPSFRAVGRVELLKLVGRRDDVPMCFHLLYGHDVWVAEWIHHSSCAVRRHGVTVRVHLGTNGEGTHG